LIGAPEVMDPLNQASAARAHVGHTHDRFRINGFRWREHLFFRYSTVDKNVAAECLADSKYDPLIT
jgi:hypothetical protein